MSGLYIHVPYCHAKCAYCDFYSTPSDAGKEEFVNALLNEFQARRDEIPGPVDTIYIGGGTPSSLPTRLLDRIISALPTDELTEFTIEVNPEDINENFTHWLRGTPITRVSMGVQSFDDVTLHAIGRRHTAAQAAEAIRLLQDTGLSISLDLIYGLPGQTIEKWEESVVNILQFKPEHLSAYLLSYEPGTRLTAMLNAGKIQPVPTDTLVEMYHLLCRLTSSAGYDHYEISNFARPGHQARHNSSYWNLTPYLGLGPGAHSYDGARTRSYNPHNLRAYISASGIGVTVHETENIDEAYNDFCMVSLRTKRGLDLALVHDLFGERMAEYTDRIATSLATRQLLEVRQSAVRTGYCNYRIPETEWLTADATITHFIRVS